MSLEYDHSWMWHPDFSEHHHGTAGLFVHFRRYVHIQEKIIGQLKIRITADTRYRLFINQQLVSFGPVKGDSTLWFYDEMDIAPFLRCGVNHVAVHVLRFFHSTSYAPSFPRLPIAGLWISVPDTEPSLARELESSELWETAIDYGTILRIDEPEDHFMHIYEKNTTSFNSPLTWTKATVLGLKVSTGNSPPWHLSPRMIPRMAHKAIRPIAVHNINSPVSADIWKKHLTATSKSDANETPQPLSLSAGTEHCLDLEAPYHVTAFVRIRFKRPEKDDSILKVRYSESYEDIPAEVPWVRRKGDRRDHRKQLYGPQDIYHFRGSVDYDQLGYYEEEAVDEIFMPFHFRTFRFLQLHIIVGTSALALKTVDIEKVNYPLDVCATFQMPGIEQSQTWNRIWTTSIRTLGNCMHDCYEDCPLYEQLQYAMDTRSSSLFTYNVSGDGRLAKQALIQLHNSFQARIGLLSSRAPTHRIQIMPHFSLFWILMLNDYYLYHGDEQLLRKFLPVVDSILGHFAGQIREDNLVTSNNYPYTWNFVDWTPQWKPHGIPSIFKRTGISTYTNQLYAHALSTAANLVDAVGRYALADEYRSRNTSIIRAIMAHCFNGEFFSDTVARSADPNDYSQHCQVWAVLSGCISGKDAQCLLRRSLQASKEGRIVGESISMTFYTLRAISVAGGSLYDEVFHELWKPWVEQLSWNVSTWVEDAVSQRSDCHAWGCVPIYEICVEVSGIRPARPGYKALEFRPRLRLFGDFKAVLPLKMVDGQLEGKVHVSWRSLDATQTEVILRLDLATLTTLAVLVSLPGYSADFTLGTEQFRHVVHWETIV